MYDLDLATYLNDQRDLLFRAESGPQLMRFLDLAALQQPQIGFVSPRFPLLSNLTVLENIVLHRMYRNNFPMRQAEQNLRPLIKALGMHGVMDKRKEFLTADELVRAHFLRCIASGNSIAILESPPRSTLETSLDCRSRTNVQIHFWICSLKSESSLYRKFALPTIDLNGEKHVPVPQNGV